MAPAGQSGGLIEAVMGKQTKRDPGLVSIRKRPQTKLDGDA
jgi:hypothetical protein